MNDNNKTKAQLIEELNNVRRRVDELEKYENLYFSEQSKKDAPNEINQLMKIFNSVMTGIVVIDPETMKIIDINDTGALMIGSPKNEIMGQICHSFICPAEIDKCPMKKPCARIEQSERELLVANGERRKIFKTVVSVRMNGKECYLENFIDITERKKIELQLIKANHLNQMIIDSTPAGIWMFDQNGQIKMVNKAGVKLVGGTKEELLKVNFNNLQSWKNTGLLEAAQEVLKTGKTLKKEIHSTNEYGNEIWVDVLLLPFSHAGKRQLFIFTYDIKAIKHAESELLKSQTYLSNALKIARIGYWEYDVRKNIFIFNDQFYSIYRTTAEEVGGYLMSPEKYAEQFIHPDDREVVAQEIQLVLETEDPNFNRHLEHRIIYADGEIGFVSVHYFVKRDYAGRTVKTFGANQDITLRKRAEEEKLKLETQLRRSQKLETIGTLAGGIAHDFNNMLMPIMGYADLALTNLEPSDPLVNDLNEILNGAKRAKELVSQILIFSRQLEQERKPIDLQLIITEALRLVRPSIPTTIEIRQIFDGSCEKIMADAAQMHQVIVNLCTNAFQAMEKNGGILTIQLKQVKIDEQTAKYNINLTEKEYAQLTIKDTGVGMDPVIQERIFEPFFTTKAVNEGTGMGLSVVHGIVTSHRGEILVSSESGKGSTFQVYIPVIRSEENVVKKDTESMPGGNEAILIIDDEDIVGKVLKRMLDRLGYTVILSNNCPDALENFRHHKISCNLVLTDLTMPNMTGLEFAKQLHTLHPNLPVILMTGYGEHISREIQKHFNIKEIIGKPIAIRDLAEIVRCVLDG